MEGKRKASLCLVTPPQAAVVLNEISIVLNVGLTVLKYGPSSGRQQLFSIPLVLKGGRRGEGCTTSPYYVDQVHFWSCGAFCGRSHVLPRSG